MGLYPKPTQKNLGGCMQGLFFIVLVLIAAKNVYASSWSQYPLLNCSASGAELKYMGMSYGIADHTRSGLILLVPEHKNDGDIMKNSYHSLKFSKSARIDLNKLSGTYRASNDKGSAILKLSQFTRFGYTGQMLVKIGSTSRSYNLGCTVNDKLFDAYPEWCKKYPFNPVLDENINCKQTIL